MKKTQMTKSPSSILREARIDKGYTYLQVANETGLSISTIVNSERGDKKLTPRTIKALVNCYNIKMKLVHNAKDNIVYL